MRARRCRAIDTRTYVYIHTCAHARGYGPQTTADGAADARVRTRAPVHASRHARTCVEAQACMESTRTHMHMHALTHTHTHMVTHLAVARSRCAAARAHTHAHSCTSTSPARTLECMLRAHADVHTCAHTYVDTYVPGDRSVYIAYIYI